MSWCPLGTRRVKCNRCLDLRHVASFQQLSPPASALDFSTILGLFTNKHKVFSSESTHKWTLMNSGKMLLNLSLNKKFCVHRTMIWGETSDFPSFQIQITSSENPAMKEARVIFICSLISWNHVKCTLLSLVASCKYPLGDQVDDESINKGKLGKSVSPRARTCRS